MLVSGCSQASSAATFAAFLEAKHCEWAVMRHNARPRSKAAGLRLRSLMGTTSGVLLPEPHPAMHPARSGDDAGGSSGGGGGRSGSSTDQPTAKKRASLGSGDHLRPTLQTTLQQCGH